MLYSPTRLFNEKERERERESLRFRTCVEAACPSRKQLEISVTLSLLVYSWRVPHALTIDGSAMKMAKYVTQRLHYRTH